MEGADLSNILQLRNVCLYVLALYAGFFRSEEVLNIKLNHIYFHEGYMTIKVEKSKADQLRQGDEVLNAQSGGTVCAVSLLEAYLSKLDIDPHSSEFIFRPLVKTKSSYKLVQKDKPISYSTFRDQLAKSLQNVVPDPSVYGTHSFRSGGASRAANSGVSDRAFQRHGRWKSVAAISYVVLLRSLGNILHDLAAKYDHKLSIAELRHFEKTSTKARKARLDVNFLKDCQSLHVFPRFITFALPNASPKDVKAICFTSFQLKIKEAMHILWEQPSLNSQVKHLNLSFSY